MAKHKQLFGGGYEVSVQVEKYTDEQMLIALADENAGDEESVEAQVDVVRLARSYLKKNPEACKVTLQSVAKPKDEGGRPHEHGSERCVLAFLGENTWNERKVHNLFVLADRVDASGGSTAWLDPQQASIRVR